VLPQDYLQALLQLKSNYTQAVVGTKEVGRMDEAFIFTLSSLLSMVKIGVIQQQFSEILTFITEKLEGECKEDGISVKYGIVCLQFLLHS
jgi:hypothetical protein